MKNLFPTLLSCALIFVSSCKKDNDDPITPPVTVTPAQVLTDFANFVAIPNYQDLQAKANDLNIKVQHLNDSITDTNLDIAQEAWRSVRIPWEQAEGFLFGPAEDFNYDPATDSWPVNTVELDSLLSSSNPLEISDIEALQYSLRGYHPIEFVLFGVGGSKTASQLTARELKYLISLTQSLYNTVTELRNSWDLAQPGNFTEQFVTAGNGSTRYPTRKDAFLALVSAMGSICGEVAETKMEIPYAAQDSELVESQYAHNATIDFKNNIIGVQNAYMCRYTSTGKSLHDLVAAKDLTLDNAIQSQITTAINALNAIDPNYGLAIFTQNAEILQAMNAINNLGSSMDLLVNFVQVNITD